MTTQFSDFDRHMMAIALTMARRGLGRTRPNPSVGAVIADEPSGELIARGVTADGGRPHAETQAIASAGARARGATMYVTLEPCSHHGVTAPCADAIFAAGLKRVVAATEDPDPRVAGRGLERLRAAGIEVQHGLFASDARWIARGHIVRVTERRPFVTLKMALDADGNIARGRSGKPAWVTGEHARAHGAMLRAKADAIMVGSQTVRDDDPLLTCRLPGMGSRSPVRVVLAKDCDTLLISQLVATAREVPTWILTSSAVSAVARAGLVAKGVDVIDAAVVQNKLWLPSVMEALVARGITRLLVEGGPTVWRAFADASLVDEVDVFMACAGQRRSEAAVRRAIAHHLGAVRLDLESSLDLGQDRQWRFRRAAQQEGR